VEFKFCFCLNALFDFGIQRFAFVFGKFFGKCAHNPIAVFALSGKNTSSESDKQT